MKIEHKDKAWDFYRRIGSPKYIVAPMVNQSEIAFRFMCRKYQAQLCYTPMMHSGLFAKDPKYRTINFQSHPEDRPLIVQFCGHNPETMLQAALLVQDQCDAVDINLGCPQGIARLIMVLIYLVILIYYEKWFHI